MTVSAATRYHDRLKKKRQAIHVQRRKLNMDDADYRALLKRAAGVTSSADLMTQEKADAVLDEMKRLGAPAHRPLTGPQKKMWSLWQQLADAGRVRDRRMSALLAWVKRQAHVDALAFLTSAQEYAAIEALKAWLERKEDPHD